MFQINVVEEIQTHILCSITFFFLNHAVYEIMWENTVQRGRTQITIRRMRILCWIPKAKRTHSQYVTLIASSLQQWLHERPSVLQYTYIVRLVGLLYSHALFQVASRIHFLVQAIALINLASNFVSWLLGLYQSV
jgi:hypothetical protein